MNGCRFYTTKLEFIKQKPLHNRRESCFEVFPDGLMDDMASKNISTCCVSYIALPMKTDLQLSPTTILATKFPTDFNSTLLCLSENSSELNYITFSKMCRTFKRGLRTQRPIHISSMGNNRGHISDSFSDKCTALIQNKQKQKYRGMFEIQKSRNKTSSGDIVRRTWRTCSESESRNFDCQ